MDANITISQLLQIIAAIGAIWGGYKIIIEIIDKVNEKHDREQKWDKYDKQIGAVKKEQRLLAECTLAILEGLKQLNCNGEVTEARDKLKQYLNDQAHS